MTGATIDDTGCDPRDGEASRVLAEISELLCHPALLDMHEWAEVGQHMTCAGAEAMAQVLRLLGQEDEATALLDLHTVVDLGEHRMHDGHLAGEEERPAGGSPRCDAHEEAREFDEQERVLLAQRLDAVSIASGSCDQHRYVLAVGAAREAGATTAEVKDAYLMPWRTVYAGLPGPGFPWHG